MSKSILFIVPRPNAQADGEHAGHQRDVEAQVLEAPAWIPCSPGLQQKQNAGMMASGSATLKLMADEEDHQHPAGFRTFALSGLLGGVSGAVSLQAGGIVIGFVFVGYAAAFIGFHLLQAKLEQDLSVTSVVAGLLTFLLGAMSVIGDLQAAIACAVAMTLLPALRETLHKWVASLTWPEIRAVLVLLAMSFLLLPLLPNWRIDPWDSINPYQIWLLAILVAGVSFVGYIAVRVFGDRLGVLMTAVAGGLASSTATTLAFARLAKEHPESSRLLSAGILIAGVLMMLRVGVVAVALNGALLTTLALPLASAAIVLALGGHRVSHRQYWEGYFKTSHRQSDGDWHCT